MGDQGMQPFEPFWLAPIHAPLITILWFESGLAYPRMRAYIRLAMPGGFHAWYPKLAGILILPLAATLSVLLLAFLQRSICSVSHHSRAGRLRESFLSVFLLTAIVTDAHAYLRPGTGIRSASFDLRMGAVSLALAGAWLTAKFIYDPRESRRPPARTALAGGLSGTVIILAFAGPPGLALLAGAVALLSVIWAIATDRQRPYEPKEE